MGRGIGGHQSARALTQTWLTPRFVVDALGSFDLDPCAAPSPRPWATAEVHYEAPIQDGLTLEWFGRTWLNPPYGQDTGRWLRRLADHGAGTALIFARTETEMFCDYVWRRADALMFLRGRLHFCYPDGRRAAANAGAPSVLVAYGENDVEHLLRSGLDGQIVGLRAPVLVHLALRPPAADEPLDGTWREVVIEAIRRLGGTASLSDLYRVLKDTTKAAANPHWQAKIRQTVRKAGISREAAGQYSLGF